MAPLAISHPADRSPMPSLVEFTVGDAVTVSPVLDADRAGATSSPSRCDIDAAAEGASARGIESLGTTARPHRRHHRPDGNEVTLVETEPGFTS